MREGQNRKRGKAENLPRIRMPASLQYSLQGCTTRVLGANPATLDPEAVALPCPQLLYLAGLGLSPQRGYTTDPNTRGKNAPTGSSASSLALQGPRRERWQWWQWSAVEGS